jgi:hypothetical protein
MDRKEFENFMSIFNRTSVFESWGSYARVSGNASLEDEKNKFGSFQLTYPDAIAILAAPPFLLRSRLVRLSLPNLPPLPPPHSSDSHSLFLSCCVCASGFSTVVVAVRCSCSCFGCGWEKCSRQRCLSWRNDSDVTLWRVVTWRTLLSRHNRACIGST